MGFQDIVIVAIVLTALLYLGRSLWNTWTSRGGCGCGCKQADERPSGASRPTRPIRHPLVTIDSVGLPKRTRPKDDTDRG